MSVMSITYSEYWYPPLPDNFPHNKTKNLHSEPIHLKWSIQEVLPSNNSILMEYGSSSYKKKKKKKEKETRPIPPLKRVQIKSSNKKTRDVLSMSPFPPSPLNIFTFHKIGIWSSTNLLRTTLRLGNTGNQGMLHSSYPKLHISALE